MCVNPASPAGSDSEHIIPPPPGIHFRVMKAADIPEVRTLHASLLPVQYPLTFFIQLLLQPRYLCVLATHEDSVIAFASAAIDPSHGTARPERGNSSSARISLLTLGVQPIHRRQGIGRALVHDVARRLRASSCRNESQSEPSSAEDVRHGYSTVLVQAEVAHSNTAGKFFYSRLGMDAEPRSECHMLQVGLKTPTCIVAGLLCV
ncbi:acyl-CoA N-acyltransferase [Pisolithus croceorrhizus]|nr:acyl-CoA N-acyltransferase [Pisolithus croceorrhizus]